MNLVRFIYQIYHLNMIFENKVFPFAFGIISVKDVKPNLQIYDRVFVFPGPQPSAWPPGSSINVCYLVHFL